MFEVFVSEGLLGEMGTVVDLLISSTYSFTLFADEVEVMRFRFILK